MGECSPPTAADWANANASDARRQAEQNADKLSDLIRYLAAKGIVDIPEFNQYRRTHGDVKPLEFEAERVNTININSDMGAAGIKAAQDYLAHRVRDIGVW
ncbi:hypothetical protein [Mycolicibacterium septicum]|uniref:hypothetical protein n=1 Tax=Mycolicibacterium septicum TaxID=98668 RepID=UPI001AF90DC8|nr:hypothetical protein [Mycolicibacterium septicum]QRY51742.1 hypothetical protein JVX95_30950 [Mycolicibacterium septicum]